MGFQGNLQSYNLADLFQNISSNARTGMLRITGPRGEKIIYFAEGQIRLLSHGLNEKGLLIKVLQDSKLIEIKHLDEAEKSSQESKEPLINVLCAKGYIEEETIIDIVCYAIEEDIYDLFTWEEAQFDFTDGPPDDQLFEAELFAAENVFNTNHLVMEAARRSDEWARIRSVVVSDENVFVVINEARNKLEVFEKESNALQVVMYIDGYKSVRELVKSSGLAKFDLYEGLFHLYQEEIIQHRTFEELFQIGVEFREKKQLDKAIVFLRRALELQQNVECLRTYAELYEMSGDKKEAAEQYAVCAREYVEKGDEDTALETFKKVAELDPEDTESHNEIAKIYSARDMTEEAVAEYIIYAENLLANKSIQKAREICYRILNLQPHNHDAHRLLAKGYLWEGNSESAIAEYKALAQALLANMSPKQAIKEYSKILDEECNFPAVKDGVKDFLLKSGEVQSYGLKRILIATIIFIVIASTAFIGWIIVNKQINYKNAQEKIGKLESTYPDLLGNMKHLDVLNKCKKIIEEYYTFSDIKDKATEIRLLTEEHLQEQVDIRIEDIKAFRRKGKYNKCLASISETLEKYTNESYSFLKEHLVKVRNLESDVKLEMTAKEIFRLYKNADIQFDNGHWGKSQEIILEIVSTNKGDIFKNEDEELLRALTEHTDTGLIREQLQEMKNEITSDTTDLADSIKKQIENVLTLYGEILEAKFDAEKQYQRYLSLKSQKYDPDKLKQILNIAAELGSSDAQSELKKFDEMQAREILRASKQFEAKGEYEKALNKIKFLTGKYGHTEIGQKISYFFVINTNPDNVNIKIDGKDRGKTGKKKAYRYAPGEEPEVLLYYPTFKTQKVRISRKQAVYHIEMIRGPEKTFSTNNRVSCDFLVIDDVAYFGDASGFLYALSLDALSNEWEGIGRDGLHYGISGTPFEYRDIICFGNEHGDVIAVSRNGAKQWTYRAEGKNAQSKIVGFAASENPIKMGEFLLFFASNKGVITAVDADDGTEKWKKSVTGIESGLLVLKNKTALFFGGIDGVLYGLDLFNIRSEPSKIFKAMRGISTNFSRLPSNELTIFFGSKDKTIYAVDLSEGIFREDAAIYDEFQTHDWIMADIRVEGSKLYFGSYDHNVYCITFTEDNKFKEEWIFEAEDKIESEVAVINNMVYVGCTNGKIYAIDSLAKVGKFNKIKALWEFETDGRIKTGLKVWDDYLIVPGEQGTIYKFKIK